MVKRIIAFGLLLCGLCCALTAFGAETDSSAMEETLTKENRKVWVNASLTGPPVREEIWYWAHRSEDGGDTEDDITGKMKRESEAKAESGISEAYYTVEIPNDYDQIRFLFYDPDSSAGAENTGDMTDLLDIPEDLDAPCFYLDADDPSAYDNVERSGYWDEAFQIRDPEKEYSVKNKANPYGKDSDTGPVEIPEGEMTESSDTLYLDCDLYDYYSDRELNGLTRESYGFNEKSQRNWVPFRNLDEALSDEYRENGGIPLYVGHFQPDVLEEYRFSDIAPLLNLTGWDDRNGFFSTNNSTINVLGEGNAENSRYDYAAQGLIGNSLKNGYPLCADRKGKDSTEAAFPLFSEKFLEGNNSKRTKLGKVYRHAAFPFHRVDRDEDGIMYWSFDSADDHMHLIKNTVEDNKNGFDWYLGNLSAAENPEDEEDEWSKNVNSAGTADAGTVSDEYGFFPFNNPDEGADGNAYDFGFGMRLAFDFYLPEGKILKDKNGADKPVIFTFSGDDDLWVFLDGKLVLDVGGDHGKADGTINFTDQTACVSRVKKSQGNPDVTEGPVTTSFEINGDDHQKHQLALFYMERGMWESNLKLQFNMAPERVEQTEPSALPFTGEKGMSPLFPVAGFGLMAASLLAFTVKNRGKKKIGKQLLLLVLLMSGAVASIHPTVKAEAEEVSKEVPIEMPKEVSKDVPIVMSKDVPKGVTPHQTSTDFKESDYGKGEESWVEPLEGTATLTIRNFPEETDFYAVGISDGTLEKYGIKGADVPVGKLAEAACRLDKNMTARQKELIHADGLIFRGLAFGKTYLITGHSVRTEEGIIKPMPFLFRPDEEQKNVDAEAKYTLEKIPTPTPTAKRKNPKSATDKKETGKTTQPSSRQKSSGTSLELKKRGGKITLEPVRTGDVDLKEIGITIISAFILGLAVIIRKKIK